MWTTIRASRLLLQLNRRCTAASVVAQRMTLHCGAVVRKDLEDNPFFTKYKEKLDKVQGATQHIKQKPTSKRTPVSAPTPPPPSHYSYMKPPSLDSVMKVDLIADKDSKEIEKIWVEFHKTKDCICAVMQSDVYTQLHTKATHSPLFIYPLPRGDGYEFMMSQFSSQRFYFTSLLNYQHHGENAPPCLTLTHYTELQNSKGIVLMHGEVDTNVLSTLEAQYLANQVLLYYSSNQSERYALVRQFNHQPNEFDYNTLLEQLGNTGVGP